jgi:uncharacterized protein (DUF924 family)
MDKLSFDACDSGFTLGSTSSIPWPSEIKYTMDLKLDPCFVLDFWFKQLEPDQWFEKSDDLDAEIRCRFKDLYVQILAGEHEDWQQSAEGSLATILVLDQFSRNMFRDQAQAFAADDKALVVAQMAVKNQFVKALEPRQQTFVYMPYMHSEDLSIHEKAVELFKALGNETVLDYEYKHKAIIDRFERYPHRNKILGRTSTPEELAFLKQPNSSF